MTTIRDVARIAGVSVASVSRVINNGPKVSAATREKVNKIMQDIGYTPNANARALVMRKSMTIGVVIPELTDPFFASLANGIDKIARKRNMQLLLSTSSQSEASELAAINLLVEQRCEVIVLHSKQLSDEQLIRLCEQNAGLVIIDRYVEQIKEKCIWLDNEEGGKMAARHLLSLQHLNIACISSKYDIEDPMLRLKGFTDELKKSDIDIDKALVTYGEPNQKGGEIAAQHLLASRKKFTAIFVYNDAMAVGVITTLEDNGYSVPNDISVIGFDDALIASYSRPRLTTLHYPVEDMAQRAAELALQAVGHTQPNSKKHEGSDESVLFTTTHKYLPHLIKRESTTSCKNIFS